MLLNNVEGHQLLYYGLYSTVIFGRKGANFKYHLANKQAFTLLFMWDKNALTNGINSEFIA